MEEKDEKKPDMTFRETSRTEENGVISIWAENDWYKMLLTENSVPNPNAIAPVLIQFLGKNHPKLTLQCPNVYHPEGPVMELELGDGSGPIPIEKAEKLAADVSLCRETLENAWKFVTDECPEAAVYDGPVYSDDDWFDFWESLVSDNPPKADNDKGDTGNS